MNLPPKTRTAILVALLVAVLFGDVLVGVRGFFRSDLSSYHYPLKKVVRDQTLSGIFPYLESLDARRAAAGGESGLRAVLSAPVAHLPAGIPLLLSAPHPPAPRRIEAEAGGQAFLIASNTHHRYWRAFLDGAETELHPINIAFHGVIMPAGRHVIELRYCNPLILPFGLLSLLATGSLLFLGFKEGPKKNHADSESR